MNRYSSGTRDVAGYKVSLLISALLRWLAGFATVNGFLVKDGVVGMSTRGEL